MKKFKAVLFFLAAIFMVVSACKKDKDEPKKNQFTYGGANYNLTKGIIENYGQYPGEGVFNFDVILLSSGLTVYESNGEPDSISGIGNAIVIEFYSTDSTDLATGEYNYNVTGAGTTFEYAFAAIDFNTDTEEGTEVDISGGSIAVSKSGINYELTFSFETIGGNSLSGYYMGPLTRYDYKLAFKSHRNTH